MRANGTHNPIRNHVKEFLLLFSVPLGIIVILIGLIYLPRLFANPTYDFIYCEGYSCLDRYSVDPATNTVRQVPEDRRFSAEASLRYYDASRDATRPISQTEAESYRLDPMSKSPEGYELELSTGSGGFLFWGDYSREWHLKKGMITKPISLGNSNSDKQFVGWVLK